MNEHEASMRYHLGGPPSTKETPGYETMRLSDKLTFGHDAKRCPKTNRIYEQGSGCLSHPEQTKMFLAEQAAEKPREGDFCPYSGQPLDCSVGALPKIVQIERLFADLPDEVKAQWFARAASLQAIDPAGTA
jgi:hypothetical protein